MPLSITRRSILQQAGAVAAFAASQRRAPEHRASANNRVAKTIGNGPPPVHLPRDRRSDELRQLVPVLPVCRRQGRDADPGRRL